MAIDTPGNDEFTLDSAPICDKSHISAEVQMGERIKVSSLNGELECLPNLPCTPMKWIHAVVEIGQLFKVQSGDGELTFEGGIEPLDQSDEYVENCRRSWGIVDGRELMCFSINGKVVGRFQTEEVGEDPLSVKIILHPRSAMGELNVGRKLPDQFANFRELQLCYRHDLGEYRFFMK